MMKNQQRIEQVTSLVIFGAIVVGCGFILRPFVLPILWAAVLCLATWPVYELLLKWLGGRRNLAALLMAFLLVLVLFIPFLIVGLTFTANISSAIEWFESLRQSGLPPPPEWIERIPLAGKRISEYWAMLAESAEPALDWLKPWLKDAAVWLLRHSLDFAHGVFQIAMSVLIAFFLYRDGEGVVAGLRDMVQRISGDFSKRLIEVVKVTVRSVVYGVLGTALVQGVLAGIGFLIARVPSPVLLGLFTFFLGFIPAGPPIIWICAAIWLFSQGRIGWGVFMVLYGFFVISSVDNFIRPYIISRGSALPFIMMFIGVIGGIATLGFIGIFIGPTLLTVGYSLIREIFSNPSSD